MKIYFNAEYRDKFPIGAQGAAAICTGGGGFSALRRTVIRTYTWLNWLYPILVGVSRFSVQRFKAKNR